MATPRTIIPGGIADYGAASGGGSVEGFPVVNPPTGVVANYSTLTSTYPAASNSGYFAWVQNSSGVPLINYKKAGWYYSDGATWSEGTPYTDTAAYIEYDNASSGLLAENVQAAIDELDTTIGVIQSQVSAIDPIQDTLTGFTSAAGTLGSADTILEAIQKLDGNVAAIPVVGSNVVALDFGAGAYTKKVSVADTAITANTEISLTLASHPSRDADELEFVNISLAVHLKAGVGFDIYATSKDRAQGLFNVHYMKK